MKEISKWVNFNKSDDFFSESFKATLSNQLESQFQKIINKEVDLYAFGFSLEIGFDYSVTQLKETLEDELNFRENDGYVFMNAQIAAPSSEFFQVTIAWTCSDKKLLPNIYKTDNLPEDLKVMFCNDFPKERISKYFEPMGQFKKGEEGLAFPVDFFVYTFPDVYIEIKGSLNLDSDKNIIDNIFNHYNSKDYKCYCSGLVEHEEVKGVHLDYNLTEDPNLIKKRMEELLDIFKGFSENEFSQKIDKIVVK